MKSSISIITVSLMVFFFFSCNNEKQADNASSAAPSTTKKDSAADKGIGKFTNIRLTHPLDDSMVVRGKNIYDSKCMSCHKLSDEKLVGPGWKGVTDRRTAEWVMNFITNTNVMLDSDLVAQQLMVTCVARMPNQNLGDDQARAVLEYMRKNDGKN